MLRSLITSLQVSVNHGLLKQFGTAVGLRNSFHCNVLQDGSEQRPSAPVMADWCRRVLQRC